MASNLDKYFQNSSEFLPERWLKAANCPKSKNLTPGVQEDEGTKSMDFNQHHAFASLPFGYGKRMCLGKRFADLEIQTVICKVNNEKRKLHVTQQPAYNIHR